jgi:predicted nucleic acid-binding protein
MKILFDTNVIVAGTVEDHPDHHICVPWLRKAQKIEITGYLSTHSIAELYAVMTRLPLSKPLHPQWVKDAILYNLQSLQPISQEDANRQLPIVAVLR